MNQFDLAAHVAAVLLFVIFLPWIAFLAKAMTGAFVRICRDTSRQISRIWREEGGG